MDIVCGLEKHLGCAQSCGYTEAGDEAAERLAKKLTRLWGDVGIQDTLKLFKECLSERTLVRSRILDVWIRGGDGLVIRKQWTKG